MLSLVLRGPACPVSAPNPRISSCARISPTFNLPRLPPPFVARRHLPSVSASGSRPWRPAPAFAAAALLSAALSCYWTVNGDDSSVRDQSDGSSTKPDDGDGSPIPGAPSALPYNLRSERTKYLIVGGAESDITAAMALLRRDGDSAEIVILGNAAGLAAADHVPPNIRFLPLPSTWTIEPSEKICRLWTPEGDPLEISYERCLINVGGTPEPLPGQFAHTELVQTLSEFRRRLASEPENFLPSMRPHIVVLGGGIGSVDEATRLVSAGAGRVSLIMKGDGVLDGVLPPTLSQVLRQRIEECGVSVLTGTTVVDVGDTSATNDLTHEDVPALSLRLAPWPPLPCEPQPGAELAESLLAQSPSVVIPAHFVLQSVEGAPVPSGLSTQFELTGDKRGIVVNSELEARRDHWVSGPLANYYDMWLDQRRSSFSPDHDDLSASVAALNMTDARLPYVVQPYTSWQSPLATIEFVGLCDYRHMSTIEFWTTGDDRLQTTTAANPKLSGVIYYVRPSDRRCVGVLTWNAPNQLPRMTRLVEACKVIESPDQLKRRVPLHPHPSEAEELAELFKKMDSQPD